MMLFREEPVTPVIRRWMCAQVGCNGELLSTGEGITRLSTRWKHRCGKCGHEDRERPCDLAQPDGDVYIARKLQAYRGARTNASCLSAYAL
jgi:hypothetical protein